ncbi:MAG: pilin, partial [Candidatus Uhrbacteria bacterium]|nr:pilin [Candidatus Uhrbacteria bacterium]
MHYCYAESSGSIDLGVDIGSMDSASDIGEYIVAAYDWLIPAAALIAVTMMMIGGLQYALARGKSAYIDKGKKRIANAIAGLVLLLSAYVIAKLIDPRLISFEPLKTPLIKEVTMLSAEETCSTLADKGFTIQASGGTSCGDKGTIQSMDGVKGNVSTGSWKVGDKCDYSYCPNNGSCTSTGECKLCAEIPTPSVSTCSDAQALGTGSSAS